MSDSFKKQQLFTSAPIGKAVVYLAVPTVIAQLITVIYNMADTFSIGQLGDSNQVAAATLAMPLFMFLTAYANLFGIGGAFVGILNIVLDPIFIFLFKMEITGAAIATMLSNVAATVFFILFLFKKSLNHRPYGW